MSSTPPTPSADAEALAAQTVAELAQPGTFFNGAERIALAEIGLAAWDHDRSATPIPEPFQTAAVMVASEANTIRRPHVDSWALNDLDRLSLVELISVIARLAAVDAYHFALDLPRPELPARASERPATFEADAQAVTGAGWVPTIGPATPATALTALPREYAAYRELHTFLYLPIEAVDRPEDSAKGPLIRPQMELIAARASWLNKSAVNVVRHTQLLASSADHLGLVANTAAVADPFTPSGIDHGAEILAFVDAAVLRDVSELGPARSCLETVAGPAVVEMAARVAAAFEMVTRVVDSSGIPLPDHHRETATDFGIVLPDHLLGLENR